MSCSYAFSPRTWLKGEIDKRGFIRYKDSDWPVENSGWWEMDMGGAHREGLSQFLNALKENHDFQGAFVHHHHIPHQPPDFGFASTLNNDLRRVLADIGIDQLYSHQVEAIEHIRMARHVIVATPTASGKSLIYNIAVLEKILEDEAGKALFIFPLKALEQDQMKNLRLWLKKLKALSGKKIGVDIYDGDTSPYKRKKIREAPPHILFTTPDMLHHGILAHHHNWASLLKDLRFVVLDEVHTYRGIFGSHVSQVISRLKRMCGHYGSAPRFVLLSATVSNPEPFARWLIQDDVSVVRATGSPVADRHFLFFNPHTSANFFSAKFFLHCVQQGFRTIAFTQSRKVTELIHIWVTQMAPGLGKKISSYRAGFMPEERRDIEQRLATGNLLGVISTSALEMGIDIGYLDVCLLVGYPGTIIDTWQRGGRVGRSGRASAIVLVGKPDALDQYFMKYPKELFQRSYEAAVLDPHNANVAKAHLPCAAAEIPLQEHDETFWPKDFRRRLEDLEREGVLSGTVDGEPAWFATQHRPHRFVNMRSAGESYTILDKETRKPIGTVDGIRAFKECHEGAVYLHKGRQYLVEELDLAKRNIIAGMSKVQYFTRSKSEKETDILEITRSKPAGQFIVREGHLRVTEVITGYEKRAISGHTLIGKVPLDLPPHVFETVGIWIEIEDAVRAYVEKQSLHFMGGIHAVEHGAIGIFPLFCLCDRDDIGGIAFEMHSGLGKSAIFIYDGYPGGVGLAQHGFDIVLELLDKTFKHIDSCPCENGCPSCIHSPKCGSGNNPLDKKAALTVLACLLGHVPLSEMPKTSPKRAETAEPPPLEQVEKRTPRIVFFDLETQKTAADVGGWQNVHLMLVSVAVVFDTLENRFCAYAEKEVDALLKHLGKADLVVGFNIKRFDYRVLRAYTGKNFNNLKTFDILEDVYSRLGFRLSLDHLAQETLGHRKTAHGLQAVEWFRQGEMEKLTDYCQNDVAITRDLFFYGLEKQHLIYRGKRENRRVRLLVDWALDDFLPDKNG